MENCLTKIIMDQNNNLLNFTSQKIFKHKKKSILLIFIIIFFCLLIISILISLLNELAKFFDNLPTNKNIYMYSLDCTKNNNYFAYYDKTLFIKQNQECTEKTRNETKTYSKTINVAELKDIPNKNGHDFEGYYVISDNKKYIYFARYDKKEFREIIKIFLYDIDKQKETLITSKPDGTIHINELNKDFEIWTNQIYNMDVDYKNNFYINRWKYDFEKNGWLALKLDYEDNGSRYVTLTDKTIEPYINVNNNNIYKYSYDVKKETITSPENYCSYEIEYPYIKNIGNINLEWQINNKVKNFFFPTLDEQKQCDETHKKDTDGQFSSYETDHIGFKAGRTDEQIISLYQYNSINYCYKKDGQFAGCGAHPNVISESLSFFIQNFNNIRPATEDVATLLNYIKNNTETAVPISCGIPQVTINDITNNEYFDNFYYLEENELVIVNPDNSYVHHACTYRIPYKDIKFVN